MPLYEYVCRTCGEKIAEVLTMKEHDTKKVQCPKCQSTELEKIIEPFFAKTARKSGVWQGHPAEDPKTQKPLDRPGIAFVYNALTLRPGLRFRSVGHGIMRRYRPFGRG